MTTPEPNEAKLLEIVDAIRALTPAERRRLVRRLRISGLWEPEEFLSDRDRLRNAPALGERRPALPRAAQAAALIAMDKGVAEIESLMETIAAPAAPAAPATPPAAPAMPAAPPEEAPYRPPARSKVVVPDDRPDAAAAQEAMAPLPGQAPEAPIGVIFDGGTQGDPPVGYGRYAIRWPGMPQQIVRLRFSEDVTGPEAEYDTLIAALEATLQRLQDNDAVPQNARLDIRGDSQIVLDQVKGQCEVEDPHLLLRCDRVHFLLRRFAGWTLGRYHRDRGAGAG